MPDASLNWGVDEAVRYLGNSYFLSPGVLLGPGDPVPTTKKGFEYPYAESAAGTKPIHQPKFLGTAGLKFIFTCGESLTSKIVNVKIYLLPQGWKAPDTAKQVQGLKRARAVLRGDRRRMQAAIKDLNDKNSVFCGVSGLLLEPSDLPEGLGEGWDEACDHIPDLVKAYLDADRSSTTTRR